MKIVILYFLLLLCGRLAAQSEKIDFPLSALPVVFAPGFVSDGFDNRDMAISPNGDELFFTIQHKTLSVIMTSKKTGTAWTLPEVATFSGKFKDLEAAYSADGKKAFLFF